MRIEYKVELYFLKSIYKILNSIYKIFPKMEILFGI